MPDALIALHFQNDICHPDGRIPFARKRSAEEAVAFLAASAGALQRARAGHATIVHVHIAFNADYSDLPRNCPLFEVVEKLGAVKSGTWGAAPLAGFEPQDNEILLMHNRNSAFRNTKLEQMLAEWGVDHIKVMGSATQFSVEHTVRDAADIGYRVTVLSRCCASADEDAHGASLRVMTKLAKID